MNHALLLTASEIKRRIVRLVVIGLDMEIGKCLVAKFCSANFLPFFA